MKNKLAKKVITLSECAYYGTGWEDDDPACMDCPRMYLCREKTRGYNKKKSSAITSTASNYRSRVVEEEESSFSLLFNRVFAGVIIAICTEIKKYLQEYGLNIARIFSSKGPDIPLLGSGEENKELPQSKKPKRKIATIKSSFDINDFDPDEL